MRRSKMRFMQMLCGLGLLSLPSGALYAEEPLSFGVLNQQPAAETAALWNPILKYVTDRTGIALRFKMGPTVQDTDAMTGRGEFDFLYSNHQFDPRYDAANYRSLVQWGGHPLIGQIVVQADSKITSLSGLAGKTVAFPSRDAFVAYKVTMAALKAKGVTVEPVFAASQQGTAVQLQTGRVEAASLNKLFADKFQKEGKGNFRVLYESEAWPNIPVAVHPRIDAAKADAVRKALLGMSQDAEGKKILEELKIPGFLPVEDKDYDATRRLYRQDL